MANDTLGDSIHPEDKKVRQFIRARGNISSTGGHQAHLSALAYMSDSYFIGTISRVHDIPRFSSPAALKKALSSLKNPSDLDDETIARYLKELSEQEAAELVSQQPKSAANQKEVSMMVSLDHTIYFHNPRAFRADEWIFSEMSSPWAGEGRGLVTQEMWSKDGVLIATCVQEVSLPEANRGWKTENKLLTRMKFRESFVSSKTRKPSHGANCEVG